MPATATPPAADALADLPGLLEAGEGFAGVEDALRRGRAGTIDGAWGSSAPLAAGTLAKRAPRTTLVVIAHPGDLDAWADDLHSFTGLRPTVFPADEDRPGERLLFDTSAGRRLRLVRQLMAEPPRLLLAPIGALLQPVPSLQELSARGKTLRVGDTLDPDGFLHWLVAHGYKRADAVEMPAEFSRRGGILDVFSPDSDDPVRVEFFGDEVESIRRFSAQTQRSLPGDLTAAVVLGHAPDGDGPKSRGHLCDYLPPEAWAVLVEPEELVDAGRQFLERVPDPVGLFSVEGATAQLLRFANVTVRALPSVSVEATAHLKVESVERFSGQVARVREELDAAAATERVLIACATDAECKRLGDVLSAGQLALTNRLKLVKGHVRAGFRLVDAGVVVVGSHELFHRDAAHGRDGVPGLPRRRVESRAIDSFLDLNEGDLVVHVGHGIARYRGMRMVERGAGGGERADKTLESEALEEHLVLEFRDGVLLYVPASKIDLVQKYVGGTKTEPELSKLGGTSWLRKKEKVQEAVHDLAVEMLQLQAVREARPGEAYPPDSDWQKEFEAAFPYQETPDQLASLTEIKADMERPRPMDRLVCGDVGYGKTELALRAAFKAVDNGKQVAVLVPTTVLAEQHFRTFGQRFAEYPFVVEGLNRFRGAAEQRRILKAVADGGVDVIVGTHRLISSDVKFKDLGLVIIDEEQRFGVEHKEKLKRLRATVDILTLTATPIPRTLHLALLGIRDVSNLETPPADRLPIETRIVRFDPAMVRHAIQRELNRDGQVYFVHNRVYDINAVADRVRSIVPDARVVIGHGQMDPRTLEAAMLRFVREEADILVATTIIESGLDIPNANTIFIDEADTYGLADLHQLRGRVGRQKNRAYAYLLVDANRQVSTTAAKRLKAIEEFTSLGAGFKIAMRDLEIRGAGNILGTQQSGHIAAVGYELYCSLLENAVRSMKKMPLKTPVEVTLNLPWPAYLPRDYVPGQKLRIEVYRRLARVREVKRLQDFAQELRDRYGPTPEPADWLLKSTEIRLLAARWQVHSIHRFEKDLVLGYRSPRLAKKLAARSEGRLIVADEKSAYYRVRPTEEEPGAMYRALRSLLRAADEAVPTGPA